MCVYVYSLCHLLSETENKNAKLGRFEDQSLAKLYLEALETGEEEPNTIRVIVVGHKGAGKTTLVRKLLGKPTLDESHESTEGIEIHVHKCKAIEDGSWIPVPESDRNDPWMKRIALNSSSVSSDSDAQSMEVDAKNTNTTTLPIAVENLSNSSKSKPFSFEQEDEDKIFISTSCEYKRSNSSQLSILSDEDLLEFKTALEKGEVNKNKTINIWDFAGQNIFYATHQLFLSSEAVYLLVVDLSKDLNTEIHEEQGTALRNVSDFCEFWINSIYTFAATERGPPPIMLVGTHSDYFDNNEARTACDELFDGIMTSSDRSRKFITGDCENDNLDILDETESLRKAIVKISRYQAMKIPKRWIPLEKELMLLKEGKVKYLPIEEVQILNTKSNKPLETMKDLKAFLTYHHNMGGLVYFNETGLSDWVVLDPKWIIDAFSSIITTTSFFEKRRDRRPDSAWKKLNTTAKVDEIYVFEQIWKPIPELYENRKWLLQVMQKLHMIARLHSFDDKTNQLTEQNEFIIPSFLANRRCNNSDIDDIYKLEKGTDMLSFHLKKTLVSRIIYYHLVATAIQRWQPYEKRRNKHLLFDSIAVFQLDAAHVGLLERCSESINIIVKNICNQRVDANLCDKFRRCTETVLKTKLKFSSAGKDSPYRIKVKCGKKQDPNDEIIYYDFEDLKTCEQFDCLECQSHMIRCDDVMRQWFSSEDWVYGFSKHLSNESKEICVKDEDLLDLANSIEDGWELLGICLGFTSQQIYKIGYDSNQHMPLCIFNMLQKCLKSEIGLSWGHLISAIDKASHRGLTVNSDSLKDCLENLQ